LKILTQEDKNNFTSSYLSDDLF